MTTRTRFPVLGPTGKTYSPQFQTTDTYAAAWTRLLDRWRTEKNVIHCLCRPAQPVPLVLRRYSSGTFAPARHPYTGPNHDGACQYFGPSIKGALARAYEPGVVEEADGLYKVRLAAGRVMEEGKAEAVEVEPRPRFGPGAPRQRAMTALGLLTLLWEIAALHEYRPAWAASRAKPASVAGHLLDAATNVRWGRACLSDSLQVGPAPPNGGLAAHNREVATAATEQRTRLVVISQLKPYSDGTQTPAVDLAAKHRVPLAGWDCARPFLGEAHAHGLQRSFQRELDAWRAGAVTFAVLIVQPQPEGEHFDLVRIALMHVSPRAIPLDSGYEAEVEEALVAQDRSFDKPLRYVDGDNTLPDFRLLDTDGAPLPMEVFGRSNPDYLARMHEKVALYDRQFTPQGWWRWEAFAGAMRPAFPSVRIELAERAVGQTRS